MNAKLKAPKSGHTNVHNHFNQKRHLVGRQAYRLRCSAALAQWQSLMAWTPAPKTIAPQTGDQLRLDCQHRLLSG